MSYFQAVLDGYSLFHNPEYVEDRLKAGVIFGAFVDGRLAGFVSEHHEAAWACWRSSPHTAATAWAWPWRASRLTATSPRAGCPSDQVIVGNEKSMSLQKKVGMELSKDTMSWLHRK